MRKKIISCNLNVSWGVYLAQKALKFVISLSFLPRGIGQGGLNIIRFKVRKIPENLRFRNPLGKHPQNICDADAHPANAWATAAFVRFYCNALQEFHDVEYSRSPLLNQLRW